MTDPQELEAALEAILFVTSEPLPRARLLAVFDEADQASAGEALERVLARWHGGAEQGVRAEEVAGGIRLVTRPELHGYLKRFFEASGSNKLSMAALETLAIIAYRQPITGPEIQDLRGKSAVTVLKSLLERRLIRIVGRKEVVGRPFLYSTTRDFLLRFGLKKLDELPPLEEFEEIFGDEGSGGASEPRELPPVPDREETILREAALLDDSELAANEAPPARPEIVANEPEISSDETLASTPEEVAVEASFDEEPE